MIECTQQGSDRLKKTICLLLVTAAFCLLLGGTGASAEERITAPEQLNSPEMTIGVDQGSAVEKVVQDELPLAKYAYFNDKYLGYEAVAQGKIDAFAYDYLQMKLTIEGGLKGVHLLPMPLGERLPIAVGISPTTEIPDFQEKLNRRFLRRAICISGSGPAVLCRPTASIGAGN